MRAAPKPKSRTQPKPSAERVRAYRAKMKKEGMRLVQKWVMDRQSPSYQAELKRQARNLAAAQDEEEVMRFIEAISVDWDE